jgi:hypothetical protein
MVVASTTGHASSANVKIIMPTIPINFMTRTSTIVFASGVRGLATAARNAVSDDKIALDEWP